MKKSKKILFVVDVYGWAFYNDAKQLASKLDDTYSSDILIMNDINFNVVDMFLIAKDYDLIHIFWRGFLSDLGNEFTKGYIHNLGLSFNEFINNYVLNKKIITAVYDHTLLEKNKINIFLKYVTSYYVCSSKLFDIYNKLDLIKKPAAVITDGVDLNFFYKKTNRLTKHKEFIIGWAGNSKWGNSDNKGVNSILKPCIKNLRNKGYNIKLNLADSSEKKIPITEMPDYYTGIDVYVCVSEHEGTPNPILEAMACGIPIISTDVGVVNDVFGPKQKEFILKSRTIECLEEAILKLYCNRNLIKDLSSENLESIKEFSWHNISKKYNDFLKKI